MWHPDGFSPARFTRLCGALPAGFEPPTSGKAIGSLISGIFFLFLPASIVAVILGHLSLSEIRKSAGRIKGQGIASHCNRLVGGHLGTEQIGSGDGGNVINRWFMTMGAISADPLQPGVSGNRHFHMDETAQIRSDASNGATSTSPPLQGSS